MLKIEQDGNFRWVYKPAKPIPHYVGYIDQGTRFYPKQVSFTLDELLEILNLMIPDKEDTEK